MKIIVASDSHGKVSFVDYIFNKIKFDCFIFCGDGVADFEKYYSDPRLVIVSGNCDWFSKFADEQVLLLLNKRVFATHGHKYFVKHSLNSLVKESKKISANLVLYGHTHHQSAQNIDGIWFVNPGTLKLGQYVTIDLQETGGPIIEQNSIVRGDYEK